MPAHKTSNGGIDAKLLGILAGGALLGAIALVAFDKVLAATSTDGFCLGCHNHAIPLAQHQLTSHHRNRTGVAPGCSDCHVQKEFLPKMQRKLEAAVEVWGHVRGVIDTEEKYRAHQPKMRERELARFRASDSATCRSCHDPDRMNAELQSAKAVRDHAKAGKTCVDCHEDAGHAPEAAAANGAEESFDF